MALEKNSEIVIVHSLFGGEKTDIEKIRRGEELLDQALKIAEEKGVKVRKRLLIRGKSPGEGIVDIAEELNAEMIVMGCGLIRVNDEILLSKTTEYVIINAKQPVLLVK